MSRNAPPKASFNGRIWRENVLENGTEAVIGLLHERNVRMWAAVSLGGTLRDIPKNGCGGVQQFPGLTRTYPGHFVSPRSLTS